MSSLTPKPSFSTKKKRLQTPATASRWQSALFSEGDYDSSKTPAKPAPGRTLFNTEQSSGPATGSNNHLIVSGPSPWRAPARKFVVRQPQRTDLLDRPTAQSIVPAAGADNSTQALVLAAAAQKKKPTIKRPPISSIWSGRRPKKARTGNHESDSNVQAKIVQKMTEQMKGVNNNNGAITPFQKSSNTSFLQLGVPLNQNLSRLYGTKRFKPSHFSEPGAPDDAERPRDGSKQSSAAVDKIKAEGPFTFPDLEPFAAAAVSGIRTTGLVLLEKKAYTDGDSILGAISKPPPVASEPDRETRREKASRVSSASVQNETTNQPPAEKWKCNKCGTQNDDDESSCQKCNTHRGEATGAQITLGWGANMFQTNKWKCNGCLGYNEMDAPQCRSCELAKGAPAPETDKDGKNTDGAKAPASSPAPVPSPAPAPSNSSTSGVFAFGTDQSSAKPTAAAAASTNTFPGLKDSSSQSKAAAATSHFSFGFSSSGASSSSPKASVEQPKPATNFSGSSPKPTATSSAKSPASGPTKFTFSSPQASSGETSTAPVVGASTFAFSAQSTPTAAGFGSKVPEYTAASSDSAKTPSDFQFGSKPAGSSTPPGEEKKSESSRIFAVGSSFGGSTAGTGGQSGFGVSNGGTGWGGDFGVSGQARTENKSGTSGLNTDPFTGKPISAEEAKSIAQFQPSSAGKDDEATSRKKKRSGLDDEESEATTSTNGKKSASSNFLPSIPGAPFQNNETNESAGFPSSSMPMSSNPPKTEQNGSSKLPGFSAASSNSFSFTSNSSFPEQTKNAEQTPPAPFGGTTASGGSGGTAPSSQAPFVFGSASSAPKESNSGSAAAPSAPSFSGNSSSMSGFGNGSSLPSNGGPAPFQFGNSSAAAPQPAPASSFSAPSGGPGPSFGASKEALSNPFVGASVTQSNPAPSFGAPPPAPVAGGFGTSFGSASAPTFGAPATNPSGPPTFGMPSTSSGFPSTNGPAPFGGFPGVAAPAPGVTTFGNAPSFGAPTNAPPSMPFSAPSPSIPPSFDANGPGMNPQEQKLFNIAPQQAPGTKQRRRIIRAKRPK